MAPKSHLTEERSRAEQQVRTFHYLSMNAYDKHKKLVNDYLRYYSGGKTMQEVFKRDTSKDKTDLDVIKEHSKFLWDESEDMAELSWEKRLAKRYYDKLFKEYCICDLTLFEQNKIALRWRTEKEVVDGKGQFVCGSKKCQIKDFLKTWEVNFGYMEDGEKKNALVKLRLCPDCSFKLNFRHQRREVTKPVKVKSKDESKSKKSSKRKSGSDESSSSSDEEDKKSRKKRKSESKSEADEASKAAEASTTTPKETTENNMIILEASDSIWKSKKSAAATEQSDVRSTEEQIESYLEDLFF